MLWDREDAEDATQEILVRVVTRPSQFDQKGEKNDNATREHQGSPFKIQSLPTEPLDDLLLWCSGLCTRISSQRASRSGGTRSRLQDSSLFVQRRRSALLYRSHEANAGSQFGQ